MRPFDAPPLRGPWHLAPNPYGAIYIPGGSGRKYERAISCCLPGCAGHGGRDVDRDSNDNILRAVWSGRIHRYSFSDFGYNFGLITPDGHEAFYAHCSQFLVGEGSSVAPDQAVAVMGSTGNTTGEHLHFEVRTTPGKWCTAIDPTDLLLDSLAPPEDEMFIIKKQTVSQMYVMLGNCLAPITANAYKACGSPKIHTYPDDHWLFGLPKLDPTP